MEVLAISDIHLERRELGEIPDLNGFFDVLVCAGDIWEGEPEQGVQCIAQIARGRSAIIVPGNHDFYRGSSGGHTIREVIKLMRREADRQNTLAGREIVSILSADNPVCEIEEARFVGLTLWSDWGLAGHWMEAAHDLEWEARGRAQATRMKTAPREYGAIRTERGSWTPYDAVAEHAREKAILIDELACIHDGPTVVVTHHPPIAECVDAYRGIVAPWWAPAFYVSDTLKTLPQHIRPEVWICGHVHAPFDARFGRTRVVCNPIEGKQFNPNLLIRI